MILSRVQVPLQDRILDFICQLNHALYFLWGLFALRDEITEFIVHYVFAPKETVHVLLFNGKSCLFIIIKFNAKQMSDSS